MKQNESIRNTAVDAYTALWAAGTLKIYTGAQPADPDDAASGTLLATIDLPNPAFAAAAAGVAAKSGVWSVVAADTGTAGYARMTNAAGTKWIDISIGEGAGELSLDETDIVVGNNVLVNTFTVTMPDA